MLISFGMRRLYKPSMLHETSDRSFSTFALVHLVQYNEKQLAFSIKIVMLKTENQTKVYIHFEDSLETSPKIKLKQPPT